MQSQLNDAGQFINQFGFPIFFGVISLGFSYLLFRYFTTTIEKKDCDFLDYAKNRDDQMMTVVSNHNSAFVENTHAVNRLSTSIETRINREVRKDIEEKKARMGAHENDVTLG